MPDVKKIKVSEGKIFITNFDEAVKLKNMVPGDDRIIKEIYEYLLNKKSI